MFLKLKPILLSLLVLKVTSISMQALLSPHLDIKDGHADHCRVQGLHLLQDVGLQLVQGGRAGAVDLNNRF